MNHDVLKSVSCYLLDMDGTLYLGEKLLPGAQDLLAQLMERNLPFYCLTNNSSRSRRDYRTKFERLGLEVAEDRILTSGEATAEYLLQSGLGERVFLVGTPSLEEEFAAHGFRLTMHDPDVLVLGFDTTLTYAKLETLCSLVRKGLPFIATHPDINCPTEHGPIPDVGAMIAFVQTSTGRDPDIIVGKPFQPMIDVIQARTQLALDAICMVGDRLYTDMAMGRYGIRTVLVLSGETKVEDLEGAIRPPDLVLADVGALATLLQQLPR